MITIAIIMEYSVVYLEIFMKKFKEVYHQPPFASHMLNVAKEPGV